VPKLRALAARVDELVVLADGAVPEALPEGTRMRTFHSGSKLGRGARFEAALSAELPALRRSGAVVAHMCPIYAVLSAPLARPLGIPVVLWYTHWHSSPTLRLAERASSAVASVDRRSFPLLSPKVHAIGHGIDLDEFPCRGRRPDGGALRVLALGRYSPAKGLATVLRAVRRALDDGLELRLEVRGPALTPEERSHRDELVRLADELRLGEYVLLAEPLPRSEIADLFAANDVLVNNMRAGAPDKVVYEAAASCLPVLASNPVFDSLLDERWRFERDDPRGLAARLAELASLDDVERERLGRGLRERVASDHSVERWAEQIVELAEET
jgi:glycosyltransferase involved in cell wall biosynthesis